MPKAVLLDIDGVLMVGGSPLPGAPLILEKLKERFKIALVSNITRSSFSQTLEKLRGAGFHIGEEELFTPIKVAVDYIKTVGGKVFALTTEEAKEDLRELEGEPVTHVLVGDAYTNFTYHALNKAFRYLIKGARLVALAENRYFKDKDGELSLDAGPFVRALEYASGQRATLLGKPSPTFFLKVLEKLGVSAEEAVMVGDDIEADVLGAQRVGMKSVLVKTGKFREEDLQKCIIPHLVIPDVTHLLDAVEYL
ncbi:HAD-superfamily subfamily IIA hydrolase like protein [Thermocrinis albus DSM 14484]|uniref:Haloacid dehalogenase-like hydrolase domain-containing protein 2 n=1 Tax=Thermocrinis albus (strain DSM 14484 / JCM 11386 / HI 11/12) TaxID=638303 RepID=D3SMG6_THEAH|nr:TIGR01458 family HAD-type hydrolase [Thermocrinis albus]ADC89946.1 HAD-superfamily subfamily IIA hydrolase like protein [Thermocrinis albus DSM 14484]